jgi:iron complex transport system ATP-binding protein
MLGMLPLAGGAATILGRAAAAWDPAELARTVAAVSQREEPAFPITVQEAAAMGRYPHLGPWRAPRAADREAVERALTRADVTALRDRWVQTLSGGEWQRVRLARALAQEPRALVLDEPTASLDVRHEMELFELVSGLVREQGLAALIVSHHLNAAARFADRLVLLAAGRVVADDTPERVLDPARLTAVFEWPIAVHRLPDGAVQLYPERPHHSAGDPS